ncbi:hypothetical protein H0H81_008010 [Sphagnurus paluster]|uniref:Uncharacterized protein n=1 Tax=Sphagnurus paluster TaxID=117069 RepID=A0A9P7GN89_9AGAR|nr:hypothetical protein H0H81_008010 [Sphagnurus paluster]
MSRPAQPRFAAYRNALAALAARTGTPLPSLIVSFAVLHEVTAVVPLVAFFYGSRSLGIGESVVGAIVRKEDSLSSTDQDTWMKGVFRGWVEEGDAWAARVGRRYGIFGYEKRVPGASNAHTEPSPLSSHIAGDVANAIVAYGASKALLPVRVGISLYLSPAFSRTIVEPLRKTLIRPFRR